MMQESFFITDGTGTAASDTRFLVVSWSVITPCRARRCIREEAGRRDRGRRWKSRAKDLHRVRRKGRGIERKGKLFFKEKSFIFLKFSISRAERVADVRYETYPCRLTAIRSREEIEIALRTGGYVPPRQPRHRTQEGAEKSRSDLLRGPAASTRPAVGHPNTSAAAVPPISSTTPLNVFAHPKVVRGKDHFLFSMRILGWWI
ncbi:hypothetical protein KM043_014396 [Ampulex compressa]|nr:hypothetical protein KM043_014396 [Ampulex compressa]